MATFRHQRLFPKGISTLITLTHHQVCVNVSFMQDRPGSYVISQFYEAIVEFPSSLEPSTEPKASKTQVVEVSSVVENRTVFAHHLCQHSLRQVFATSPMNQSTLPAKDVLSTTSER